MSGVRESGGGKMETTGLEQQYKKKKIEFETVLEPIIIFPKFPTICCFRRACMHMLVYFTS